MKNFKTLLLFILTILFVPINIAFADGYSQIDSLYEVAWITDSGTFETIETFDNFENAVKKMKENQDYVVRSKNGYSTTKIVAMNSGTAYPFPSRNNGADTLTVYEHLTSRSDNYKYTYVADEYEMIYEETSLIFDNGKGMVKVNLNGFDGYTDLEYVDLVPTKFLKNNLPIWIGDENYDNLEKIKMQQSYYSVEQNDKYLDLVFNYFYADADSKGNSEGGKLYLCPAFEWMNVGVKYYSTDGIDFYYDNELTNFAGKGYDYYLYLPLRSKTGVSADVLNSYVSNRNNSVLKNTGQIFIDAQNEYGVNALMLFSMAIQESGYGTSFLATNKNNLFGWNAIDSSPISSASTFGSVEQCIKEQASLNLRGYLDISDWRFFGSHIGNKGSGLNVEYASDPYWGMKISSIAYRIDKSSNDFNGKLTDYNKYDEALITEFNAPVKNEKGSVLYTTAYGTYYQKMFTAILLDEDVGKIQTTNAVENGVIKKHRTNGELNDVFKFNFDTSVGYINISYLDVLNKKDSDETITETTGKISIKSFEIKDNKLNISGTGIIDNVIFNNTGKIKQEVILEKYNGEQKSFEASITADSYNINDGNNYVNAGFEISIPVGELNDSYILKLKTSYGNKFTINNLRSSNKKYSNQLYLIEDNYFKLFTNQLYNYRFEIDTFKFKDEIKITKPSSRTSLLSYDKISLDKNNIDISGQAMIYYTDYSSPRSVEILVVNDDGEIYNLNSQSYKCPINYSDILNIEENSDYICFDAKGEIPDGEYSIFASIQNGEYSDLLEFTNRSQRSLPSNEDIEIRTDVIRNRIRMVAHEQ